MPMTYKLIGNLTCATTAGICPAALSVSAMGFGCMGLSEFYGPPQPETDGITLIQAAFRNGVNFFDTADAYAYGDNEVLVGKAIQPFRDKVILASKCGIVRDRHDSTKRGVDGSYAYIMQHFQESCARLGTDYLDLYYLHRVDDGVTPIEESMRAMKALLDTGKIRGIGLSEVAPSLLRRAHAIAPITALQTEYSLWRRQPEIDGSLATCRELGIAFISYSPLGRGFLTGVIASTETLAAEDFRRTLPRFQGKNLEHNRRLVEGLAAFAATKGATPAQIALAWVMHQPGCIPIPGTTKLERLADNIAAADIRLTPEDLIELDRLFPVGAARGERYTPAAMAAYHLERDDELS